MFRKIVSGLPFSPALAGQLGFYARRLRKEEVTRRFGLLFTALALVMQSFAVFSPPEAANAAHQSDFISGGVRTVSDVLAAYDQSHRGNGDFKQIMDYAGINRIELAAMQDSSVNSQQFGTGNTAIITWDRMHRFSSSQGEIKHDINIGNKTSTIYSKPLWLYDNQPFNAKKGSTYEVFIGRSDKLGWFAINKSSGNLLSQKTPKPAPKGTIAADCKVVSGYAYDARHLQDEVSVYLYFGGPPGKGDKFGPVKADTSGIDSPIGEGHGYRFTVPAKYAGSDQPIAVYGVLAPKTKWSESSVQLGGAAYIPAGCRQPTAAAVESATAKASTCKFNTKLSANHTDCQPCPGNEQVGVADQACASLIVQGKEVKNLTQNINDANHTTVHSGDRIEYTIYAENNGAKQAKLVMAEELTDVLEYSSLHDLGGASFDSDKKVLSWGSISLQPNERQARTFVVKINSTIPATPQGISQPGSYDCLISNTFGNNTSLRVDCPTVKFVESAVNELPRTGVTANVIFGVSLAMVVTYFYARSRQMNKEVRLIRHDFNMGTI